ncbi:MAG: hypothetical protein ACI8S7_000921 [Candidatus Krumholzibacteriia bacterium]|jgi:hypothetical protein
MGQSVLIGLAFGGLVYILRLSAYFKLKEMVTGEVSFPFAIDTSNLIGQRMVFGQILDLSLLLTFYFVLVMALILIRKWIKNLPLSLTVAVLFGAMASGESTLEAIALNVGALAIMMFVLLRWGMVSFLMAEITFGLCFKAFRPSTALGLRLANEKNTPDKSALKERCAAALERSIIASQPRAKLPPTSWLPPYLIR